MPALSVLIEPTRRQAANKEAEETLIRDVRAGLRPAQCVESKLRNILKYALVPVSQIRLSACCQSRSLR